MASIRVGRTDSGKIIAIQQRPKRNLDVLADLIVFSYREKFDVLMATEYLYLREARRKVRDMAWLDALELYRQALTFHLGDQKILSFKRIVGLNSAFAARDYGKSLVFSYFRS